MAQKSIQMPHFYIRENISYSYHLFICNFMNWVYLNDPKQKFTITCLFFPFKM